MKLEISLQAHADVEECLFWSAKSFGIPAARRYQKLIFVALEEICQTGKSPNSGFRLGIPPELQFYHLRHSRKKAAIEGIVVKRPRHFVVYRRGEDEVIQIIRILHDSMDITKQLEEES